MRHSSLFEDGCTPMSIIYKTDVYFHCFHLPPRCVYLDSKSHYLYPKHGNAFLASDLFVKEGSFNRRILNSLRPSDVYILQETDHHWFR